jgi:hypothetical protein
VDVGQPLALWAGVVQVEHRGDGVDPQAVDVELVEPVQRVGDQEVLDLLAPEVEHQRAPVGLLAAARVGVLVERAAVEAGQRPLVAREVRRHPVDDHAVAVLVQVVDEVAEVVGTAEARGGRVVGRHLVAPRATERVLGHRQQLDVGEAGLVEVVDELVGHLAVVEARLPRAQVHLVDAHRLGVRRARGAGRHPLAVAPLVAGVVHHRRGGRRDLGGEGQRVGLVPPAAVPAEDAELVAGARLDAGHEQLPHPGAAEHAHRVRPARPAVEVAGDPQALGRGRPDREAGPGDRAGRGVVVADVGAQDVPEPLVAALADQVQVDLAERGQPAVRVVDDVDALAVAHGQPVVRGRTRDDAGEQPGVVHPDQREALAALAHHVHLVGVRPQHPDHGAVRVRVRAQDRVRVMVRSAEQAVDGRRIGRAGVDRLVEGLGQVVLAIHPGTLLPAVHGRRAWPQRSGRCSPVRNLRFAHRGVVGAGPAGDYDHDVDLQRRISGRSGEFLLFAVTPPRRTATPERAQEIADILVKRLQPVAPDGLVLYDIDDESDRNPDERPFPFLPTMDPADYLVRHLSDWAAPVVVYRAVGKYPEAELRSWLRAQDPDRVSAVFVGASSRDQEVATSLARAHELRSRVRPDLLLGGVAIPERHDRRGDEHLRLLGKQAAGCTFFMTQVVYDVNAAKNLVSDYLFECVERGTAPVPIVFTFSVVGSMKTLEFLRWLGVDVPRWVQNDLRHAEDTLAASHEHVVAMALDLIGYCRRIGVPFGINVESVSIRRDEIEQSVGLAARLGRELRRHG